MCESAEMRGKVEVMASTIIATRPTRSPTGSSAESPVEPLRAFVLAADTASFVAEFCLRGFWVYE